VVVRHAPDSRPLPPLAGRRGDRVGQGRTGEGVYARAVVPGRSHGAPVRHDGRGHGARHAGVRQARRRCAPRQGGPQPGEEGCGRHLGLRDEREPLVPLASAPREPRDHGVPRRRPDAEGGRDARDGLEPPDRLRPRLRAARGRPLARPTRRPAPRRPDLRVERLLRRAQVVPHHGVGRGDRHTGEHVAVREGQPQWPDDRAAPVQPAASRLAPIRGLRRHGRDAEGGGGDGGRAGAAGQLPHAACANRRGDRSHLSRNPPRSHPRLDTRRQDPRSAHRLAVEGVAGPGRASPSRAPTRRRSASARGRTRPGRCTSS
jgi:hypothetical protein